MGEFRLSATDFRHHLTRVAELASYLQDRIVVHRHGRDMAALVSWEDLEFLRKHRPAPAAANASCPNGCPPPPPAVCEVQPASEVRQERPITFVELREADRRAEREARELERRRIAEQRELERRRVEEQREAERRARRQAREEEERAYDERRELARKAIREARRQEREGAIAARRARELEARRLEKERIAREHAAAVEAEKRRRAREFRFAHSPLLGGVDEAIKFYRENYDAADAQDWLEAAWYALRFSRLLPPDLPPPRKLKGAPS